MTISIEMTGLQLGDKSLNVGHVPGRKNPQLYFLDGSVLRTVAFFRSEEDAIEVRDFLFRLAGSHEKG